jgi:nucleoside-diphosphate-sugar epimerase
LRILVTGADGFTGEYFVKHAINHNHEVLALNSNLLDAEGVLNEVLFCKPEAVVHLAGISFVGHSDIKSFYEVNVIGTLNLLTALSKLPIIPKSVLLASSANIYGNCENSPISENQNPTPLNDYAVSKLAMEHLAKLWMDKLPIIIARPFNYTGVGQSESFLIPKIVSHYRKGAKKIELGNLDVSRDFLDVRFVVAVYLRLIEKTIKGETINICSGVPHQLSEIIELAAEITGHSIEVIVNPLFVRSNELKTLCGSPAKLNNLVDNVELINFKDTLTWMLKDTAS